MSTLHKTFILSFFSKCFQRTFYVVYSIHFICQLVNLSTYFGPRSFLGTRDIMIDKSDAVPDLSKSNFI